MLTYVDICQKSPAWDTLDIGKPFLIWASLRRRKKKKQNSIPWSQLGHLWMSIKGWRDGTEIKILCSQLKIWMSDKCEKNIICSFLSHVYWQCDTAYLQRLVNLLSAVYNKHAGILHFSSSRTPPNHIFTICVSVLSSFSQQPYSG